MFSPWAATEGGFAAMSTAAMSASAGNPRALGFPGAGDIEDFDTVPPDPRPHLSGVAGIDEIDYQDGSSQGLRKADRQGRPSGGLAPREDQSAAGIPDVPLRPLRRLPGGRLRERIPVSDPAVFGVPIPRAPSAPS